MVDQQNMTTNIKSFMHCDTPPKEFFNLRKTSIPTTWEMAHERIISNFVKFRTYYIGISTILFFCFTLVKPAFILFIGLICLCIYGNMYNPEIGGIKFTSKIVNISTLIISCLLMVTFRDVIIAAMALLSFISIGILTHAVTIEEVDKVESGV